THRSRAGRSAAPGPAARPARRRTSAGPRNRPPRPAPPARGGRRRTATPRPAWLLPFRALGPLGRPPDGPHVHERRLRQVVPLAVAQFLEAADRVRQRRHIAGPVRERLGHDERLRQELLDAPRPVDDLLVLLAQLLDAEDGDDVLQLAVAL